MRPALALIAASSRRVSNDSPLKSCCHAACRHIARLRPEIQPSKCVDSPATRNYSAPAASPADGFFGHSQREMDSYPSRRASDRKHLRTLAFHNPMSARDRLRSACVSFD